MITAQLSYKCEDINIIKDDSLSVGFLTGHHKTCKTCIEGQVTFG